MQKEQCCRAQAEPGKPDSASVNAQLGGGWAARTQLPELTRVSLLSDK